MSPKKKELTLQETFYNLCKDLIRYIAKKTVKKYIRGLAFGICPTLHSIMSIPTTNHLKGQLHFASLSVRRYPCFLYCF